MGSLQHEAYKEIYEMDAFFWGGGGQLISRPLIDAVGNTFTNEWAFTCVKLTFSSSTVYLLATFIFRGSRLEFCLCFVCLFKLLHQILYFTQPGSHKPLISIGGLLMYFLLCCGLD